MDAIANFIHDKMATWGIENLTFSQAESERMNGLATHLYFSTAGLRLKNYDGNQVAEVLNSLTLAPLAATRNGAKPDIYLILGEAWWRDPSDAHSPIDTLTTAGFAEAKAISPVEVMRETIARAQALNPRLNAICTPTFDAAMAVPTAGKSLGAGLDRKSVV